MFVAAVRSVSRKSGSPSFRLESPASPRDGGAALRPVGKPGRSFTRVTATFGFSHGALSVKASSHELGNVAVSGDGHADHRPLRHSGIVLVALERGRILFDL